MSTQGEAKANYANHRRLRVSEAHAAHNSDIFFELLLDQFRGLLSVYDQFHALFLDRFRGLLAVYDQFHALFLDRFHALFSVYDQFHALLRGGGQGNCGVLGRRRVVQNGWGGVLTSLTELAREGEVECAGHSTVEVAVDVEVAGVL